MDYSLGYSLAIAGIAGLCAYLGAYFKKKGENKAILSELKAMTQITENVKSDVERLMQNKIKLNALKYEALLNFYEKIFLYYDYLRSVYVVGLPEDYLTTQLHYYEEMNKLKNAYILQFAKVQLLLGDDFALHEISEKVNQHLHSLFIFDTGFIPESLSHIRRLNSLMKSELKGESRAKKLDELHNSLLQHHNDKLDERFALVEKIAPDFVKLRTEILTRIQSLLN